MLFYLITVHISLCHCMGKTHIISLFSPCYSYRWVGAPQFQVLCFETLHALVNRIQSEGSWRRLLMLRHTRSRTILRCQKSGRPRTCCYHAVFWRTHLRKQGCLVGWCGLCCSRTDERQPPDRVLALARRVDSCTQTPNALRVDTAEAEAADWVEGSGAKVEAEAEGV